jgi:FkbM family methyltransferase
MTFVDVGANWGYFTLLGAVRVGPKGVVLSLEPHPLLHDRLIQNIQRNRFEQVRAFPYAASIRRETLQFVSYDHRQDNWGTSRIVANNEAKKSCIEVQGIPLDELLRENQISHVDLMKMDIEGAEGFALAGLEGMIRERRISRLILELHPARLTQHNQSVEQILQLLIESGYRGWTIDHSRPSTRRAAYKKEFDIRDYLFPFSLDRGLDDWPHTLWTAKGEVSVVEPNR